MPFQRIQNNQAFTLWNDASFGMRQSYQSAWLSYIQQDPYMRDVIMCVELVFGGDQRFTIATVPHTAVSSSTSATYTYLPMLQEQPQIPSSYTIGGGTATQRSFSMSIDARLVKPKDIIANGRMLAGWAEISLQYPGIDYDKRFVVMRGEMSGGVRFAADREVMDFDVVDPVNTQEFLIPVQSASTDRTSGLPDESVGKRYPLVITKHPYVPALRLSSDTSDPDFLVAIGSSHEIASSDSVYRNGVAVARTDAAFPWDDEVQTDSLGTTYIACNFDGTGTGTFADGDTIYAPVQRADSRAVSLIDAIKEIILFNTLMGAKGINNRLFAAASTRMPKMDPRILINASGSNSATAFSYVESTLCNDFPMVQMAWTCGGYGPVVTDRRNSAVVANWVAEQFPLTKRATFVEETPKSNVYNAFSVRYGYNPMTDEYEGYVYRDASNSLLCSISQDHVGRREMSVLDTVTVFDDADANYIVDWMVSHYAMPSYYVEYDAVASVMIQYQLGDNIKITDDELGWTNVTATIKKLDYQRSHVTVGLCVWALYPNIPGGGKSGESKTTPI